MEAIDIKFPAGTGSDEHFLAGTLRLPQDNKGNLAGAVILHGSGPIDRDGNAKMNILGFLGNMNLNTHNRLAEDLAENSKVAVLCYDKRGIGKSTNKQNPNWYYEAGMMDLVQDAVEAYRYLCKHDSVDENNIILIGHSEGAILLPLIAETILADKSKSLPPPKGLLFLAGFGETLDQALNSQREGILKEVEAEKGLQGFILRRALTKEKLDKQYNDFMDHVKDESQDFYAQYCGILKVPTKWYREHLEWDSKKSLKECKLPILAITGGKDVQVKAKYCEPEMAKELAPNATSLETHIVSNMTHALRSIDGPPALLSVQKEYPKLGKQPLDPDLIQIIRQWLNKL